MPLGIGTHNSQLTWRMAGSFRSKRALLTLVSTKCTNEVLVYNERARRHHTN